MADISDVFTALATTISNALYPNGTSQPSAITASCKIYAGWPNSTELDSDIRSGTVHVSVYAVSNASRNTTRYQPQWRQLTNNGTSGTSIKELRRQEQRMQITVWAPTPDLRSAASSVIDVTLSNINFLPLADGSSARIVYVGMVISDMNQKSSLFKRDLFYSVEYATTITETDSAIKTTTLTISGSQG